MSNFLVLSFMVFLASCASFNHEFDRNFHPAHDERFTRHEFLNRAR